MKNEILKPVFSDKSFIIDVVDGRDIFTHNNSSYCYVDPDFRKYDADEAGLPTEETQVQVYELLEDAPFTRIAESLSDDSDKLFFTQAQIKKFIKKYRKWLLTKEENYEMYFFFKSCDELFVANVNFDSDNWLEVNVTHFKSSVVTFSAYQGDYIVVPKLD